MGEQTNTTTGSNSKLNDTLEAADGYLVIARAVAHVASITNIHPYTIVGNLVKNIEDRQAKDKFISNVKSAFMTIRDEIPFSL